MRVLLTAFEPFDETGLNSSLQAARLFLDHWGGEWDIHFAALPVSYGADTVAMDAALLEAQSDVVLHLGQATGAAEVRVERLAVNVRYQDDARAPADHQVVEAEGPAALFSTLPVDDIAEAIRDAGIPAVVSNHAGIYLCNHVLYQSLRREAERGASRRIGFLHLPCLPEQALFGVPSLPVEQLAASIHASLGAIRRSRCGAFRLL